jgi:hypothetical protein
MEMGKMTSQKSGLSPQCFMSLVSYLPVFPIISYMDNTNVVKFRFRREYEKIGINL